MGGPYIITTRDKLRFTWIEVIQFQNFAHKLFLVKKKIVFLGPHDSSCAKFFELLNF